MFRIITFSLKVLIFSIIVLVAGNLIQWNGTTVSDQIKLQMSNAERHEVIGKIKQWTKDIARDTNIPLDSIPVNDQKKLRALIQGN